MEKSNTIVLKVAKDATKAEIKAAVQKLFEVEVEVVNTLVVKGKVKRHGQRIGRRSDWKKAYVTLKEGQNLDFVGVQFPALPLPNGYFCNRVLYWIGLHRRKLSLLQHGHQNWFP